MKKNLFKSKKRVEQEMKDSDIDYMATAYTEWFVTQNECLLRCSDGFEIDITNINDWEEALENEEQCEAIKRVYSYTYTLICLIFVKLGMDPNLEDVKNYEKKRNSILYILKEILSNLDVTKLNGDDIESNIDNAINKTLLEY